MSETAYCSKTCQVRRWKGGLHGHKQEGRQKRVFDKMREASNARKHAEVVTQCVMGVGLLEQATALAVESGDDDSLMAGQNSLGNFTGSRASSRRRLRSMSRRGRLPWSWAIVSTKGTPVKSRA